MVENVWNKFSSQSRATAMVAVVSTFKTHQPCVILCMDLGTPVGCALMPRRHDCKDAGDRTTQETKSRSRDTHMDVSGRVESGTETERPFRQSFRSSASVPDFALSPAHPTRGYRGPCGRALAPCLRPVGNSCNMRASRYLTVRSFLYSQER